MTGYADEVDDYSLPEYMVLDILADGPIYRSGIIKKAIGKYGDIIDHGPYIYGEYSDDIDEAVTSLMSCGAVRYKDDHKGRIEATDYGRHLLALFMDGGPYEDEEWEIVRGRVIG